LFAKKYSDDIEFIEFDTEKKLLIGFAKLFSNYDPDIEIGYNTGGYD